MLFYRTAITFNEHFRLFASASLGHGFYSPFIDRLLMGTATVGIESRVRFACHCSYFNEIGVGLAIANSAYNSRSDLDLAIKASVGAVFDCGFTVSLQLQCMPTYKYYATYEYIDLPNQIYMYELFMLTQQVGWYIF